MNQKEKAIKKNNSARLLEHSSAIHRNCIRVNSGNTLRHEQKKFEIGFWLNKAGYEFVTEAEFKGKTGRADIFVLDDCIAIEIVSSENEESIKRKERRYPCRVVKILANETWREELIK